MAELREKLRRLYLLIQKGGKAKVELRDRLQKLYQELYELKPPRGLHNSAKDIDTEVYLYTADLIGTVNSYLAGKQVNSLKQISEGLEQRMEENQAKLNEFLEYKHKHDELLELLLENLRQDKAK